MAVTKRTRYEVLRRDGHRCRYCGATAPDVKLTVDHVTPVALGGTDDPSNLVAACADCNAGKASTSPDTPLVADVEADALRWAMAVQVAAKAQAAQGEERRQFVEYFDGEWFARAGHFAERPADWHVTLWGFYARGLSLDALEEALDITGAATNVQHRSRWRYFCGICWNKLRALEDEARRLIDDGEL